MGDEDESGQDWLTPEIERAFADPRWKYLIGLANLDELRGDPDAYNYDPHLFLQAAATMLAMQSSEKQAEGIKRGAWALVWATVGLVIATVVLVVVTVTLH